MKIYKSSKVYGSFFGEYDDNFFTKEDIVDFGYAVCDRLNALYPEYNFDIQDTYIEQKNKLVLYVLDERTYMGASDSVQIDMRKIRKPSDIYKYLDPMVNSLAEQLFTNISEHQEYEDSAGTDIKGAISDYLERSIDPPDPKDYTLLEDEKVLLEIDFEFVQQHIDGEWEDIKKTFDWAYNPTTNSGEWKADTIDYDVIIAYPDDVVDYIATLIFNTPAYQNAPSGKYKISGLAKLWFNVSGLESDREYYEDGSYDEEVYSDKATVTFLEDNSSITNLKFVPIAGTAYDDI